MSGNHKNVAPDCLSGFSLCSARGCSACFSISFGEASLGAESETFERASERAAVASLGVAVVGREAEMWDVMERVFSSCEEFRSCGFFSTSASAVRAVPVSGASIVMVEMELPDHCGITCCCELLNRRSGLKVILISPVQLRGYVRYAFFSGAYSYLTKPLTFSQCLATLRFVSCSIQKEGALAKQGTSCVMNAREERILGCLADGLMYKEIEAGLGISTATLKKLQHRIYSKLGAQSRMEAVSKWKNDGATKGPTAGFSRKMRENHAHNMKPPCRNQTDSWII